MSKPAKHFYEFGRFRIDTADRALLRDGEPVSLTPKAFEMLLVLIQNSGRVMEKNELMAHQFSEDTLDMIGNFKRLFDPDGRLNPGKLLPTGRGCLEIRQPALGVRSTVY